MDTLPAYYRLAENKRCASVMHWVLTVVISLSKLTVHQVNCLSMHHITAHRVGPAMRAGARYLDMGTSTVVRLLRQYPLARVAVLAYALLLHGYCYFLLSHMQRHAMGLEHGHMLMEEMKGVHGKAP